MWELVATALILVAQTSPPDSVNPWAQLGIASIICALLFAIVLTLWRDNLALRAKCDSLQTAQVTRERELGDRIVPLLQQSADLLRIAAARLDRAQGSPDAQHGQDLEALMHRIEHAADRLTE